MNHPPPKRLLGWSLAALAAGLFLLGRLSGILVDGLWFEALGYPGVFWRLLALRWLPALAAWILISAYLGTNLHIALRRVLARDLRSGGETIEVFPDREIRLPTLLQKGGAWLVAAVAALPFALYFGVQWDVVLRFIWSRPVGTIDPVYGRDLGFYLFRLPFLEAVQNALTVLALLALAGVLGVTLLAGFVRRGGRGLDHPRAPARRQLGLVFLIFLAAWGWGYYLDRYELLYSSEGVVYGAGFTALHVVRLALWVMASASVLLGILALFALWRDRLRLVAWGGGLYLGLLALLLLAAPQLVQRFYVAPNELQLETPFLEREIAFTRAAYGIERLEERAYPALADLTRQKIEASGPTLANVRLWDWRPLRQTFRQLQEIRLYYQFYEVDVDRYHLDGDYRQVMLAARELAPKLPQRADTWVNRTLQFTHGYGLAMSLAAQEGEEGTPTFLIRDLPPHTSRGLELTEPAIFYGERMAGYRIVNTRVKELDYPRGDENVYTSYAGSGGMPIDAFWKRLLFAWELGDVDILLSGYLQDDSRLQLRRQVRERVGALLPFLQLDADPYLVLAGGRLYWIQDAYTTSDRYPYAEPYRGLNYIRNAVKVVVDAYQGTVACYAVEPEEPVLRVYGAAFPGLFRPLEEMPEGLRDHLRYPEDLFRIQAQKYNRYHMTIPQVFYNNEDLWTLPREKYAGEAIPMQPYYILMRLPGEERLEFLLMLPLTPQNRDNMIAWLAAPCDRPDYGRLLVYKLPKEKLIFGPMQVEAMIDQDPVISRQLSLWDQRGSQVIRGNLLVIPLDHSFLYVEPVYLIAEGNNIPQLRRVIVAYGDRVAMEPTLERAVAAVFGSLQEREKALPATRVAVPPGLPEEARKRFEQAQQALQRGDWQGFGKAMGQLQQLLQKASPPASSPPAVGPGGPEN